MAEVPIELAVGTYEEFILGYQLLENEEGYDLKQTFANHNHIGSVRCLAASGCFLASGGTDELVYLFNMKKRQDLGSLAQHTGTVTCLEFFKNSHLFSGSEDGTIAVYSTSNWQCLTVLQGHRSGVTDISVHPSGSLLLSVSKDKTLRTWNLVKGRSAYVTNLKAVAEFVQWSPEGDLFVVAIGNKLDVYNVEIAGVVHTIDFGRRISCACFLNDNTVIIGGESENLELHDIDKKCVLHMFKAHSSRIKALSRILTCHDGKIWLCSVSSDGFAKIWEFSERKLDVDPVLIVKTNTTCRPTCLAVVENISSQ